MAGALLFCFHLPDLFIKSFCQFASEPKICQVRDPFRINSCLIKRATQTCHKSSRRRRKIFKVSFLPVDWPFHHISCVNQEDDFYIIQLFWLRFFLLLFFPGFWNGWICILFQGFHSLCLKRREIRLLQSFLSLQNDLCFGIFVVFLLVVCPIVSLSGWFFDRLR